MFWNPGSRSSLCGSPGGFKEQREACAATHSVHPGGRGCSSGLHPLLPGAQEEPPGLALTGSLSGSPIIMALIVYFSRYLQMDTKMSRWSVFYAMPFPLFRNFPVLLLAHVPKILNLQYQYHLVSLLETESQALSRSMIQNLHFNKIPGQFRGTLKFEKYWAKTCGPSFLQPKQPVSVFFFFLNCHNRREQKHVLTL